MKRKIVQMSAALLAGILLARTGLAELNRTGLLNLSLSVQAAAEEYSINVGEADNGTLTASSTVSALGETITLTSTPDPHYKTGEISFYKVDAMDQAITFTALGGDNTNHEGYAKLVDGDIYTKWGLNFSGSAHVILKADALTVLKRYTLTTANDNSSWKGRNWKDWTIYGANFDSDSEVTRDSSEWKEIVSVKDDSRLEDQDFKSYDYMPDTASRPYQYFKIEVTASKGASFIQMSEFKMYGDKCSEFTAEKEADSSDYQFEMPAGNVYVYATFEEKAAPDSAYISTENMTYNFDTISIEGVDGQEYIIVEKGTEVTEEAWDNAILPDAERDNWVFFDGLSGSTEYEIHTRVMETEDHYASEPVSAVICTTVESISTDAEGDLVGAKMTVYPEPEKSDYTYKWYRNEKTLNEEGTYQDSLTEIEGITGDSYTFAPEDEGKYIVTKVFAGETEVGDVEFGPIVYGTVVFDSMGGSDVAAVADLTYNSKITKPADPKKEGYSFSGWYTDEDYTEAWNFESDTVKWSGTKLFAKWEDVSANNEEKSAETEKNNSPATADNFHLVLMFAMMLISVAGIMLSLRKKED